MRCFKFAAMVIKGSSYIINQEVLLKLLQLTVLTLISDIRGCKLLSIKCDYKVITLLKRFCSFPSWWFSCAVHHSVVHVSIPVLRGTWSCLTSSCTCPHIPLSRFENPDFPLPYPHPDLNCFMPTIATYFPLLNLSRHRKTLWFGHKKSVWTPQSH